MVDGDIQEVAWWNMMDICRNPMVNAQPKLRGFSWKLRKKFIIDSEDKRKLLYGIFCFISAYN